MRALKASGKHDEFVSVHYANRAFAHGSDAFLPWHRWYINVYERELQVESKSCVTVPYWDWTLDATTATNAPAVFGDDAFG